MTLLHTRGPILTAHGSSLRFAIVSYIGDTGHVVPLLRIGEALVEAGHEVRCFLPDECNPARYNFNLSWLPLGPSDSAIARRARASFAAGRLRLQESPGRSLEYLLASAGAAKAMRRPAEEGIAEFQPKLLLADSHMFAPLYYKLAERQSAPLVLHSSCGSLANVYGHHRPLPGSPLCFRLRRRAAAVLVGRTYIWRERWALRDPQVRQLLQEMETLFTPDQPELGEPTGWLEKVDRTKALLVGTGTAVVERRLLDLGPDRNVKRFGPVVLSRSTPLPEDLGAWLHRFKHMPIVYISFGTMVRASDRLAQTVIGGLQRAGIAAVWQMADPLGSRLQRALPETLRIESYVPQATLLKAQEICAFVSHGGSGGVQESLVAGKPLLCMPVMWDQYYNAGIVSRLGAGIELRWHRATERRFAATLRHLIAKRDFREGAIRAGEELQQANGARLLIEELVTMVNRYHGSCP